MTSDDKTVAALNSLFYKTVGSSLGFYNRSTKAFKPVYFESNLVKTNASIVADYLKSGYTYEELRDCIYSAYKDGKRDTLINKVIPKKPVNDEYENLLKPGDLIYTHRELYIRSPGSHALIDGNLVRLSSPVNKLKSSFTLRDLLEFVYRKLKLARIQSRVQYDLKILVQFLDQVGLDALLYAIDSAENVPQITSLYILSSHLQNGVSMSKYRSMKDPDI